MEYYYHVSLKKLENLKFRPRIPQERLKSEDETIPRICVSDSITGCFNAIKHNLFEDVILEEYRTGNKVPIYLYGVKKDSVQSVKTPQEIIKYVSDSLENSEYWILDNSVEFQFLSVLLLNMTDTVIDCDCQDCCQDVLCHGCIKPDDWDDEEEKWEYKKDCVYPCVDDFNLLWNWESKTN